MQCRHTQCLCIFSFCASTLLVVCSWDGGGGGGGGGGDMHVALSFRRSDQCCVSKFVGMQGVIQACMEHSQPLHRLNPPTTWLIHDQVLQQPMQ